MKIFLSWSGPQSKQVAETLGGWLSQVIQAVEPWISTDIDKGARWSLEVATQLEQADFGIICLTKENLTAPWLLFEAGALAKHRDGRVCTFLLDVAPTDVKQPLAQFQATSLSKSDILSLVQTINARMDSAGEKPLTDVVLLKMVERLWPDLETELEGIKSKQSGSSKKDKRTPEDIMLEVLVTVRRMESMLQTPKFTLPSLYDEFDQKEGGDNADKLSLFEAVLRDQSLREHMNVSADGGVSTLSPKQLSELRKMLVKAKGSGDYWASFSERANKVEVATPNPRGKRWEVAPNASMKGETSKD